MEDCKNIYILLKLNDNPKLPCDVKSMTKGLSQNEIQFITDKIDFWIENYILN